MLTDDHEAQRKYLESIKNFIDETPIAIVATTNFICPKCQTDRKPIVEGSNWNEYIVLEPLNYFLVRLAQKLSSKKMIK